MFRKHMILMGAAIAAMSVVGGGAAAPAVIEYRIREGFTFKQDDGSLKVGGETIQLAADVAKLHEHKLEPVAPAAKAPAQPKTRAPKNPAALAGGADPASDSDADPAGVADPAGDGSADPADGGDPS